MNTIRRAACYFAFPKCDANDEALDVCRSVCENERIACREMNRCVRGALGGVWPTRCCSTARH